MFDQIAFCNYLTGFEELIESVKKDLMIEKNERIIATYDRVIARGYVGGRADVTNVADLAFLYIQRGENRLEVEVIRYLEGHNFHTDTDTDVGVSHFGIHCSDEEFTQQYNKLHEQYDCVQRVTTQHHTNPFLLATGRKYEYAIFNTKHILGACTKLIRRIET